MRRSPRPSVLAWPAGTSAGANPYLSSLYEGVAERGWTVTEFSLVRLARSRWTILHVHWPEFALQRRKAVLFQLALVALIALAKARGARVAWTVHNLSGHDLALRRRDRAYLRVFSRLVDGVVTLNRVDVPRPAGIRPAVWAARRCIPHGDYTRAYGGPPGRARARAVLGVPAESRILLFFGQVRPYKGVEALVGAFRSVRRGDARLIVAGRPRDEKLAAELASAAAADERIELCLRHVEDEAVPVLHGAADVVVLPYRRVHNSGAALLALSMGRRVLVPRTPTLLELRDGVGADWVHLFDGDLDAADLERVLDAPEPRGAPDLAEHAWPQVQESTDTFFRGLAPKVPG